MNFFYHFHQIEITKIISFFGFDFSFSNLTLYLVLAIIVILCLSYLISLIPKFFIFLMLIDQVGKKAKVFFTALFIFMFFNYYQKISSDKFMIFSFLICLNSFKFI